MNFNDFQIKLLKHNIRDITDFKEFDSRCTFCSKKCKCYYNDRVIYKEYEKYDTKYKICQRSYDYININNIYTLFLINYLEFNNVDVIVS
jgi:hypothetical protein